MAAQILRIIYPPTLLNTPLLNLLIREFSDLTINIIRAEVDTRHGWLEVQLVGNPALIESAVAWLQEQGAEINRLGA